MKEMQKLIMTVRKLQATTSNKSLNIPTKMLDMMNVEKGDEMIVIYNKDTKEITIKKKG